MNTSPGVKSTEYKGGKEFFRPDQHKDWGEEKIDALKKIFGKQSLKERCQLEWKSFLALVIYPEISIAYIVMYMNLVFSWGPLLIFIAQLIIFIIAMPLCNINVLLGFYTQRSFIRLWDMAPIFKGIGWSVAIYQIFTELFNTSAAGLAIIYIPHFFRRNVEWKDCNYEGASNSCHPMFPEKDYTMKCCSNRLPDCNTFVSFSTLDYFRSSVLFQPDLQSGEIQWLGIHVLWCGGVIVVHFIIFVFMIMGFSRFKNVVANLIFEITVACCIPLYMTNFAVSARHAVPQNIWSDFGSTLTNFTFWVQMVAYVVAVEMPGYNVLMGSYATPNITSDVGALIIYTMKFFIWALTANIFSAAISIVKKHYKVEDALCLHLTGHDILFVVVPDILSRTVFPQIMCPVWLLLIAFWGMLTAALVMTAFVDTLTDTFPKLTQYRLCTCSLVCIATLCVNVMLLHNNYFLFFENWSKNGMTISILFLFGMYIIGIYVYSLRNIENDYHFIYGMPLKPFWMLSVKGGSLFLMACFTLLCFQNFTLFQTKTDYYLDIITYFFVVLILLPIPVYMIYIYTKYHTSRRKMTLINPTTSWGPPKANQRQARKRFNPQREMHYKSDVTHCKHNCLLNSTRIKDEIERLNENRQKLINTVSSEAQMPLQET